MKTFAIIAHRTLRRVRLSVGLCSQNPKNEYVAVRNVASNVVPKQNASEYCMETVRKYDHENYLCTLLLPTEFRAAAFAVRAFNIEVSQVQDLISNVNIGNMRMQFWKDALESTFQGHPPLQPVSLELMRILNRHKLSKHWFKRLISSREALLSVPQFPSLLSIEEYAENSVSSVYYLILESAGIKNVQVDHAASHLGKAQGIANLLRGIPFNVSKRRIYLPQDAMIQHKISQEDLIRGRQNVNDLIYDIACLANQNLKMARSFKEKMPKQACRVFLPAIAVEAYLKNLEKLEFNVFNPLLQRRNNTLPLFLWWSKLKNQY